MAKKDPIFGQQELMTSIDILGTGDEIGLKGTAMHIWGQTHDTPMTEAQANQGAEEIYNFGRKTLKEGSFDKAVTDEEKEISSNVWSNIEFHRRTNHKKAKPTVMPSWMSAGEESPTTEEPKTQEKPKEEAAPSSGAPQTEQKQEAPAKKKKKHKQEKKTLNSIDKDIDKGFNEIITNAIEGGEDVNAAMKSGWTAAEGERYRQYAKHANSLRADFVKEEAQRAVAAKKNGETYKPRDYIDYAIENQDKLTEGVTAESKERFNNMLGNMKKAQVKNEKLIGHYQNELDLLHKEKDQTFRDMATLTKKQKASLAARNAADGLSTIIRHPMQTARHLFNLGGDQSALKDGAAREGARRNAMYKKNGDAAYEKKYGQREKYFENKIAMLQEQQEGIKNVRPEEATLYGSSDYGARRNAAKDIITDTKKKVAEKAAANPASKAGKGLGLTAKGGMALGLLAIGGILGNMMGGHGEQTNAQLYNPNPQPQYAN